MEHSMNFEGLIYKICVEKEENKWMSSGHSLHYSIS
jgi:hypothetical protein